MKLMIAVIRDIDDNPVLSRLADRAFRVTRVASTGGFMRKGNITLIIGIPDEKVDEVIQLFSDTCCPAEAGSRRATIFVVNAPHFEQI